MPKFERHIFICGNQRPPGNPSLYGYEVAPGGGTIFGSGYIHKDWIGNARVISSISASTITTDRAFAPYGETFNIFGGTGQNDNMFAGLTQDIFSGMYDTPNREYQGSTQGRFLSPDPAGAGWNQYAYPTNPNSNVDPSGLCGLGGGVGLSGGCPPAWIANYGPNCPNFGPGGCNLGLGATCYDLDNSGQCVPMGAGFGSAPSTLTGSFWMNMNLGTGNVGVQLWPSEDCATCGFWVMTPPTMLVGPSGPTNCTPLTKGCFNVPTQQQQATGSPSNLIERANMAFVQCVSEGGLSGAGQGAMETVSDASQDGEAPSTGKVIVNMANAALDVQKDCLGANPLADLSPNYQGLLQSGDPGVNPIIGGIIPF